MATSKSCSSCASDIPGDSKFCPQCGAPQALRCAACGHDNAAGSRFCSQCGAGLGAAAAVAAPAPAPAAPSLERPANLAERRQITVMFCDLVGSTALSTRLDPEDLREVMAAYHRCAAETVTRFGGYVAKYMGDGVLVYFGYPEAHEGDAENAIRAALALITAVAQLFAATGRHQVRIGLATGLVVVGELLGTGEAQERNVVGETPNLAARLQSAAAPDTVVVDATTRRLAGELFEYESVTQAALKGFAEPVTIWRVLRERTIASRFEALWAANRTPLIGREEEMDLLGRRWQQIRRGEGRVVLLAGEPGIGKSRLTAALEDSLKEEDHVCLRYFCQPHHQRSALQPIVGHLQHAAHFEANDTEREKRAKLDALLARETGITRDEIELLAELAGVVASDPRDAADMDPQRRRRRLLDTLIERLRRLTQRNPVLILFEDAHWADPTSLELLTLTIERIAVLPILLVVTFRPDYQPPWTGQPHVTMLTLSRLSERERAKLIGHIAGGKSLPPRLLDQIVERTDGIPLFVEELTKAVLEGEHVQDARDQQAHERRAEPLAIPSTLQASLMARVDRLGSAREVLQIGAAIGREFSHQVLAAIAGLPDAVLGDALTRLAEAELVFLRGTPPNAVYIFKHALVQDSAYSTMLRGRRQQLHAAIAAVLEKRFPDVAKSTPEVIAQQFERAGQGEKAIQYFLQAGDRDLRRFAMQESIAHYSNALRLVLAMAETPARDSLELNVRLGLGLAQQIALGPTAKEPQLNYERAHALSCTLPGLGRERFLATWGRWFGAGMTGRTDLAYKLSSDLLVVARELDNPSFLMEAYHARAPMQMRAGNLPGMRESAEEVIRLYDRERHRDHAYYFGGHDARICAQSFYALSLWGLGYLDQAGRMAQQCIDDARDLGHLFSLAHGLNMGSLTLILLRDLEACRIVADELYVIAERNKFPWPLTCALFIKAWLKAQGDDRQAGVQQMLDIAENADTSVFRDILFALVAEQLVRAGQIERAMLTLDRAVDAGGTLSDKFYEAEMIRMRGEVLQAQGIENAQRAEAEYLRAMAVAAQQSNRAIELRTATSLSRLLLQSGRSHEARAVLAPVCAAFTEGFERPDFRAAKALLAELT